MGFFVGLPEARLISTLISPGPEAQETVKLPTWQRNALRKLFDRPKFSPQEVYELGFRCLQRAEGIGERGADVEVRAYILLYD